MRPDCARTCSLRSSCYWSTATSPHPGRSAALPYPSCLAPAPCFPEGNSQVTPAGHLCTRRGGVRTRARGYGGATWLIESRGPGPRVIFLQRRGLDLESQSLKTRLSVCLSAEKPPSLRRSPSLARVRSGWRSGGEAGGSHLHPAS